MRVSLLLTVLCLLSLVAVSVTGLPDDVTHVDAMEEHEEHEIQQPPTGAPTRTPAAGTGATPTPTRTTPRTTTPATPATRPRTGRTTRTGAPLMFPRGEGLMFPRRMMERLRMEPETGMGMEMGMSRLSIFERRMLRRLFRHMLRLRMREMLDGVPMSSWDMRVIRMMALRDMMMAMNVQAEDAAELAHVIGQREAAMEEREREVETHDDTTDTETETAETEAESEMEAEHETEAVPEAEHELDDPRLIDPTMIESEFDISAPYGGYGGFGGYGGYGYGGYGSKKIPYKKQPYKKAPPKKQPYKKVPYKKVPYKKVPYKKGYGGYGYGY